MAGRRPTRSTYATALERFILGRCPLCGKGKGESKGVEKRKNTGDLFCHSCRRAWPITAVFQLKHELPMNGKVPPEIAPLPLEPLRQADQSPSFFQKFLQFFKSVAALVGK